MQIYRYIYYIHEVSNSISLKTIQVSVLSLNHREIETSTYRGKCEDQDTWCTGRFKKSQEYANHQQETLGNPWQEWDFLNSWQEIAGLAKLTKG